MNFTEALRISRCRGLLASLLKLQCNLVPEGTFKGAHLRRKILYQSPTVSPRSSKNKKCGCNCYCCCCYCCDVWDYVVSLPFSYSEKESQSNDTLLHFVEFSNVRNSDRSSNATRSNQKVNCQMPGELRKH